MHLPTRVTDSGTLLGHPRGLYILFLTEMWERFSFYGVRALLVFFLTQRFLFSDERAFGIYGSYTTLVYIFPLLGGIVADRYLGYNRAVLYGGLLMVAGHVGLVLQELYFRIPDDTQPSGALAQNLFYLSLAFVIAGVGLLKSNISTMVGTLYPRESPQRDAGFIIFNWGINIGATLAAFTCGYVGQTWGWHYGFGLAGAGMVLGLAVFVLGQKYLLGSDDSTHGKPVERLGLRTTLNLAAWVGLCIVVTWQLLPRVEILGYIVIGAVVFAVGRTIRIGRVELSRIERERLWCALIIWSIWASYAALLEQVGSSINLFNERVVNRYVDLSIILGGPGLEAMTPGGALPASVIEIRSSQLLGVGALLVLLLSPIFVWLWTYLERRGRNPSTPVKLCLAHCALAAGYALVTIGTLSPDNSGRVGLPWVLGMYACFSVGTLIVVPIGLSAITRLAARPVMGFVVGLWMLGIGLGSYFASKIALLSALNLPDGVTHPTGQLLDHYQTFFGTLSIAALAFAFLFTLLVPTMKKWMNGLS